MIPTHRSRPCIPSLLLLLGWLVFMVLLFALPAEAQQPRQFGDFHAMAHADPMTDADRSFVATFATNETPGRTPMLVWRCLEDGLNVLYRFDKYLGGDRDEEVRVRMRFDTNAPHPELYWKLFNSKHDIAWLPLRHVPVYTRTAMGASRVVVQVVDPLDGETFTDTFSLRGLQQALRTLSCARNYGLQ